MFSYQDLKNIGLIANNYALMMFSISINDFILVYHIYVVVYLYIKIIRSFIIIENYKTNLYCRTDSSNTKKTVNLALTYLTNIII